MNFDKEYFEDSVAVFDPGTKTGAGMLVVRSHSRLHIADTFSMERFEDVNGWDPKTDYIASASDALREWGNGIKNTVPNLNMRVIMARNFLIEFPGFGTGRRGRTPAITTLMRVAHNAASIGAEVAQWTGRDVEFFRADMLRRNGQIIPNKNRTTLFRRIYGDVDANEHSVDAGLIAAKFFNVFS